MSPFRWLTLGLFSVSSPCSGKYSCQGTKAECIRGCAMSPSRRPTGWISSGNAWGWATGHSLFNQVIWEPGHSSVSAGVRGGFWEDGRMVTQPSEWNDPDLEEGFKTRGMFKTFRTISLNCTRRKRFRGNFPSTAVSFEVCLRPRIYFDKK